MLNAMGVDVWEINGLKKEQNRIDEIMKRWNKDPKKIDSILRTPTDKLPELIMYY